MALAVAFLLLFVAIALWRLPYPFDLEWVEGGTVDHVRHILAGGKLYLPPNLEFIPFIYTPGYYYLGALVARVWEVGYVPLRLISLLASLGTCALLYAWVQRESGYRLAGILTAGLYAATFQASGAFFDLARVDALGLFVMLLAAWVLWRSPSALTLAGAALLLILAAAVKQTALALAPAFFIYAWRYRRPRWLLPAILLILGLGGTLAFDYLHDGWFLYYTLRLPLSHAYEMDMIVDFWSRDICGVLTVGTALAGFYLAALASEGKKRALTFYGWGVAGVVLGAYLSRLHVGGWENDLMPVYAFLCLLAGLGSARILDAARRLSPRWAQLTAFGIFLAWCIQFGSLTYNPFRQIPTLADLEAGRTLLSTLQKVPGEVFIPGSGFIPTLAGKKTFAHEAALHDVLRGPHGAARHNLALAVTEAVTSQRFGAIILDAPAPRGLDSCDLEDYYQKFSLYYKDKQVFMPVTGLRVRPAYLYRPRDADQPLLGHPPF